jgi:hypothetical protein
VRYYEIARSESDLASATGRALRGLPATTSVYLLNGQAMLGPAAQDPVVLLLWGEPDAAEPRAIQAGEWPATLANPARLLVAPADQGQIPMIQARYPGGAWQVSRNLHANPLLYIFDLPSPAAGAQRDP